MNATKQERKDLDQANTAANDPASAVASQGCQIGPLSLYTPPQIYLEPLTNSGR